jgi:hypothetical protein
MLAPSTVTILQKAKIKTMRRPKAQRAMPPSNKGFFVFLACCTLAAVTLAALFLTGEIQGERVAPDIVPKSHNVD